MLPPARIFIVPYRDRVRHKRELLHCLNTILDGEDDWELFFAHQADRRPFNRGAMKNIGFLWARRRYPAHYKAITFIFHDVDTRPQYRGQFPYQTEPGVVSHYYGTYYALGGAFAIKGADFERTGGFPNFWGWGLEDNAMQDRAVAAGLRIDRTHFVPLRGRGVTRAFDGYHRITSKHEAALYRYGTPDNMWNIRSLRVTLADGGMLNVASFEASEPHDVQTFERLDIRGGTILRADRRFIRVQQSVRPRGQVHQQCLRGRKRIKPPSRGIVRRWPPR